MKDLFVPYEQSLELKNLSFNESCFAYYYHENFIYWIKDSKRQYDDCKNEYFNRVEIACPTFQQVFKFFRDKYGLDVNYRFCISTSYIPTIHFTKEEGLKYKCNEMLKFFNIRLFESKEEAELEVIKFLIKIINEKI